MVPEAVGGKPLDGIVRTLEGVPWSKARGMIETGKVRVDGQIVTDPTRRVRAGALVAGDPRAPKPRHGELSREQIVHLDAHVVVVDKPAGIATIPYDES